MIFLRFCFLGGGSVGGGSGATFEPKALNPKSQLFLNRQVQWRLCSQAGQNPKDTVETCGALCSQAGTRNEIQMIWTEPIPMEHDSNQNGSMNEMNFQTEIEI